MSKSKHTNEPWAIFEDDAKAIVTVKHPMLSLMTVGDDGLATMFSDEDARRIVACVNACAGIPTDDLEQCPSGGLFHLADMSNEVVKQRDELLVALETISRSLPQIACERAQMMDCANKVIASVKGGA